MNLFKRTENVVDGWDGYCGFHITYCISNSEHIEDEAELTSEDVVNIDDGPIQSYYTYENLGPVSDEELAVFNKFKMKIDRLP